jgi:hypothetical protein
MSLLVDRFALFCPLPLASTPFIVGDAATGSGAPARTA